MGKRAPRFVVSCALVAGGLAANAGPALANGVQWASDCADWTTPVFTFATGQPVCITGDVDYTCPEELGIHFPGADIYVVKAGDPPFSSVPAPTHIGHIMGGAGSFYGVKVWSPPLQVGTYDVIIDEHCDHVFDSDDVRSPKVFTVGDPISCPGSPPNTCPQAPSGWQPKDPKIPSKSTCRGACGSNCPDGTLFGVQNPIAGTCSPLASKDVCCESANHTSHMSCTYASNVRCGSHQGCRDHDACYDDCIVNSPPGSLWNPADKVFQCQRLCDGKCIARWGTARCAQWMVGRGEFDYSIDFAGPASGPTSGSGPCP
jgi:hypothetical protein